MNKVGIFLSLILFTVSCANTLPKSKYAQDKVDYKKEGVFFGNLKINYDGKEMAMNECALTFIDSKKKENVANVNTNGYFETSAHPGTVYLQKITCKKDEIVFKKNELNFENHLGTKSNVGNLKSNWSSNKINPAVAIIGLALGWIAISTSGTQFDIHHEKQTLRKIASVDDHKHSLLNIPYGLKTAEKKE